MEKKEWIEEVINSTEGMRKLTPRESMYDAIQAKLYKQEKQVPQKTVWIAAASIVLLATLNIITIKKVFSKEEIQKTSITEVSESPLYVNNQLY